MMSKLQNTGWVIAALLGGSLYLSHCGDDKGKGVAYYPGKKEYVYDTNTYTFHYTDTVKEDTIIYREVPAKIDTQEILKDYFAKRTYTRTHEDTSLTITIRDTVAENKIIAWALEYKINRPTAINTYKPVKKNMLFVGAEFSQGVGINVGYLFKSNIMIDGGYYLNSNQVRLGVRYGIRL
jgi:hypothetical protein